MRMCLHGAFPFVYRTCGGTTNEWYGADSAVLEFECELDGISVNGIDMIHWNAAGRIDRFKVMVRPLKAMNKLHEHMGRMLQGAG